MWIAARLVYNRSPRVPHIYQILFWSYIYCTIGPLYTLVRVADYGSHSHHLPEATKPCRYEFFNRQMTLYDMLLGLLFGESAARTSIRYYSASVAVRTIYEPRVPEQNNFVTAWAKMMWFNHFHMNSFCFSADNWNPQIKIYLLIFPKKFILIVFLVYGHRKLKPAIVLRKNFKTSWQKLTTLHITLNFFFLVHLTYESHPHVKLISISARRK